MKETLELLTAEEVAERLRVRPDTVRRWARAGRIPQVRLSPKVVRYTFDDVVEALRAHSSDLGGADNA